MAVRLDLFELSYFSSDGVRVVAFPHSVRRQLRRVLRLVACLWPDGYSACSVRGVLDGATCVCQFDLVRDRGVRLVDGCPDSLVELFNGLGLRACSERLGV